ncbi:hypothetical protein QVD17_23590 [Tagetes erecta]|uniref:Uncharacterized protein n=1 Tax=Tagetes erecta TaxID=13708 RepID=A0AAD8NU88_TARER|nr:hypothetical protein QVD17_23590 [Tagetes erecta]
MKVGFQLAGITSANITTLFPSWSGMHGSEIFYAVGSYVLTIGYAKAYVILNLGFVKYLGTVMDTEFWE